MADPKFTTPEEEWRPVSYNTNYEVSNLGRIKRIADGPNTHKGRVLKPYISKKNGYAYIKISCLGKRKKFLVHRLVAIAFLGEPSVALPHVNHLDAVRSNNTATNLEWTDKSGNMKHCIKLGRRSYTGKNNPHAKLLESQVLEIRLLAGRGLTRRRIADMFNVTHQTITDVVNRKLWIHL